MYVVWCIALLSKQVDVVEQVDASVRRGKLG